MVSEDDTGSDGSASIVDMSERSSLEASRMPLPRSVRRSMDEFLLHDPPPSYSDALLPPASLLRLKLPVQPRPDEGKETLPPYSTSISIQNVFHRKMELERAVQRAQDRNWNRVVVVLQGTALKFYRCSTTSFFSGNGGRKHNADYPLGTKMGTLLKSYNLQHAEVGIAADYQKKQYVIRVRAETDQFLLSCHKIETFVLWLQSLSTAIDLAPPLDDREHPRDLSIPRSRRRSPRRTPAANTSRTPVADRPEQNLELPNISPASSTESLTPSPTRSTRPDLSANPSSTSRPRASPNSSQSSTPLPRTLFARNSTTNPNINSEGKWRPHHQWTHFYDMLYAKRCMAILMARTPRKSNFVVRESALWWVDWASGDMKLWNGTGTNENSNTEKELPQIPQEPQEDPPEYSPSVSTGTNSAPSVAGSVRDELEIEEIRQIDALSDDIDTSRKIVERIEIRRVESIRI